MAADEVVVGQAGRLHERLAGRRADEAETRLRQEFRKRVGLRRARRDRPGLRIAGRERATADIPVIIATSQLLDESERQRLSNHAVAILSKSRLGEGDGINEIRRAIRSAGIPMAS